MSATAKNVLLAGASGYIGKAVLAELLCQGLNVTALVRDESAAPPDCATVVTDFHSATELGEALQGQKFAALISCIASRNGVPADTWRVDYNANKILLQTALALGVEHFVLLSAICVQRPQLEFQRAKLAFETELIAASISHTIVRPTAFFKSLSGQIERVRAGKPFLLFGDGELTACKPISAEDLASFITRAVSDPTMHNRILPIGGPGPALTPRQQGEILFELCKRPAQFRHVPTAVFRIANALLLPLGKLFPSLAAKAELARIGRYYATESMLVWDDEQGRYDEDKTPSTGEVSLRDHYARVLKRGIDGHEAGEHKIF